MILNIRQKPMLWEYKVTKLHLKLRGLHGYNQKIIFLMWVLGIVIAIPKITVAQPQPNPLEVDRDDPLIPLGYGKRELSSFEKYRINKAIAQIEIDAQAALEQDNIERAMKLWYRQLRLVRAIDTRSEIKALAKVGKIAWQENRGDDVRNIANRLITIQEESSEKTLTNNFLKQLALAYQRVRYIDKAIDIYQQIVANDKNVNNLETLGQLYLDIFDYQNAANVYRQLLNNAAKKEFYLQTLIDIYDRTQPRQAIKFKKRLLQQYIANQKTDKIPALEIAIARDYETLKQSDRAIAAYNQAFIAASNTQQLAIASDALTRLGKLYQPRNLEKAIATYNKLITIQQQSYNYYGLINTYDTLGNLYLKSNKSNLAKQSFQQALALAKSINYRVKYFDRQVKQSSIN